MRCAPARDARGRMLVHRADLETDGGGFCGHPRRLWCRPRAVGHGARPRVRDERHRPKAARPRHIPWAWRPVFPRRTRSTRCRGQTPVVHPTRAKAMWGMKLSESIGLIGADMAVFLATVFGLLSARFRVSRRDSAGWNEGKFGASDRRRPHFPAIGPHRVCPVANAGGAVPLWSGLRAWRKAGGYPQRHANSRSGPCPDLADTSGPHPPPHRCAGRSSFWPVLWHEHVRGLLAPAVSSPAR